MCEYFEDGRALVEVWVLGPVGVPPAIAWGEVMCPESETFHLLSLKLYSSPWFISALFMGKPLRLGIISKRCRLGQERRPSGNNIGEKGNSGFGWIESHIVHSPLIGRFETRNVSTDNPRRALHYRREREDANPPHEQAEEGQMLQRRGTRNEAPIC